jgi:hypothetical protein
LGSEYTDWGVGDVDDKKLARLGAWAGIVFFVLMLVIGLLPGSPPKPSDSAAKIAKYFTDTADEMRIVTYLGGLATVAVLFWLAALYRILRRADSSPVLPVAALAGGVVTAALTAVGGITLGALTILKLQNGIDATGVRFFYVLGNNLTMAGGFSVVVLLIATAGVVVRTHVMPTWLAGIAVIDAVLWLVGAGAVTSTKDFIFYFAFAAFIVFAIWVLVVSIMMLRARDGAAAPSPSPVAEVSAA